MDIETRTEILKATNRAPYEHGYVDLVAQRIADEASVASVAIRHHFDMKKEFLSVFPDDLIGQFESESSRESAGPWTRLNTVLDVMFSPKNPEADSFPVVVMKLKAQAPYHELFCKCFPNLDGVMWEVVADTVRDGVIGGEFSETDLEEIARLITTMSNDVHARVVVLDEYPTEIRRIVEDALELHPS